MGQLQKATTGKFTLTRTTKKPSEEDNGYSYSNGKTTYYISGLGLDTNDLNTEDIGIGFMPEGKGKKIYEALLRKHSNTTKTPAQIYNLGNSAVASIKSAMTQDAKEVASCFVRNGTS
ncbi:hypothetical protein IKE96_03730 [bacterium]|nr:hypothetical protein [bacterium]